MRHADKRRIYILIYLVLWAVTLIAFWFFTGPSDAMGFSLIFLWILLPTATFVLSALIGWNDFRGRGKWLAPPAFGIMYMMAEYVTFSASNMKHTGQPVAPQFGMILGGGAVSLLGLGLGVLLRFRRGNRE